MGLILRWIWLLTAALAVQEVVSRQEFLIQPQNTEVNPGETAQLECSVLNKKGTCVWQKDRKIQGMFPGKYEWSGDQNRGDCGLRIVNARLDLDDANWECQVTASSIEERDVLSSHVATVVVREPPQPPMMQFVGRPVNFGENVTVVAGKNSSISCISRFGNPAAVFRWFVGHDDITAFSRQENTSEPDRPKLAQAISTLHYTFTKEHNGQSIKCVALHDAYDRKAMETGADLNVQYMPTVILEGKPKGDIEDGQDVVRLQCRADGNPPPFIMWRKDGRDLATSEVLQFNPISKEDSGIYTCEARNSIGGSEVLSVHLDVKYYPINVRVVPHLVEARVHNQTSLRCMSEGNPPPWYIWLFSVTGDPSNAQVLGNDAILRIHNVTYEAQGTYVCIATNVIKGKEKSSHSQEVKVNVFGVPQVLHSSTSHNDVHVEKGEDAKLVVPFCSDPPPTVIVWQWANIKLRVGEGKKKYVAEQGPLSDKRDDCFEARLVIQNTDPSDSRRYYLTVENDRGNDTIAVSLDVSEPVSMSAIIGIVIGCLVVSVVIVLVILYAFRAEKWCFRKTDDFKASEDDSESPGFKGLAHPSRHTGPGAIPPDALYSLPPKRFLKSDDEKDSEPTSIQWMAALLEDDVMDKFCIAQPYAKQSDHNENKNHARDMDYTDVEVPKVEARPTTLPRRTRVEYAEIQYRPQAHEIADI